MEQHHDEIPREQQGNNTWQESSVENSDPRQISIEAEFTIVRGGSKRGGDMLFNKDSYSYHIKRTLTGFENRKFNIALLLQL